MHMNNTHTDNAVSEAGTAVEHFTEGARALGRSKTEMVKEFESLMSAGEALLKSTANLSGQALIEARDRFSTNLTAAQKRYKEISETAKVKGRQAAKDADDYVHANPWPVIGTAAGVAFLLGVCSSRR